MKDLKSRPPVPFEHPSTPDVYMFKARILFHGDNGHPFREEAHRVSTHGSTVSYINQHGTFIVVPLASVVCIEVGPEELS